ncbi:cytochrome P450 [Byssothecium circinans]|uniref:Cytochrome P450 n=1 Tax=Byssothecium circinans TaxID=147558 RepID=A0A6A5THR1_9PLEO|nr:cytochrome P450 [Byssothecium circinans]
MLYLIAAVLASYYVYSVVYNRFFHPLAKIPGPFFWTTTRLGYIRSMVTGNLVPDVQKLHEKYGDIVRTAPDEVSFARKEVREEIFGARPVGELPYYKNPIFFKSPPGQPTNLVTTINLKENQRMRKVVTLAFTERALRYQEPVIIKYAMYLIEKFHEMTREKGADINVNDWFNFFAFDLIGNLSLGESFGCMEGSSYHPWVKMLYAYLKGMVFLAATRFYPVLETILMALIPPSMRRMQDEHYEIAQKKIQRRMNFEKELNDFMTPVLSDANKDFKVMSGAEVESTYQMLIIAGSETTATALTGTINHLAQNHAKLAKLAHEIRSKFQSIDEIDNKATRDLHYLNACINEGLRLCNPIPAGLPRCVPETGGRVCGYWLPGCTSVIVSPMAIAHNPKYFHRHAEFIPERWLSLDSRPKEFHNDALDSQYPFGTGPRHCPSKLLAWTEMRIVIAMLLLLFDIDVVPGKRLVWEDLRTFFVVEKEPVYINIKPRVV